MKIEIEEDHALALVCAAVLTAEPPLLEAAAHVLVTLATATPPSRPVLARMTTEDRVGFAGTCALASAALSRARRERMTRVEARALEIIKERAEASAAFDNLVAECVEAERTED